MSDPKASAVVNPVAALRQYGQSVWLDFIRRSLITGGDLKRYVDEDGLGGVTSNPAIFEKAIDESDDYTTAIAELAKDTRLGPREIFERLAIKDIQDAADVLRPVYDRTASGDGYVSLEVAPDLAKDTAGTIAEARRLWKAVNRPNVMIKVPATPEGVPAIRTLLTDGININITLLFARSAYEAVAHAYLDALEARVARGEAVDRLASVASFFVSRIDTMVDAILADKIKSAAPADKPALEALLGKVAIANAKLAYVSYQHLFSGARWDALVRKGAHPQRVLWASTSTKNKAYRDTMYVEELIGPDTVDTIPPETLAAFKDHGRLRSSLVEDVPGATHTLEALERAGISLTRVTDDLIVEAVKKFVDPFMKLLDAVARQAREANPARVNGSSSSLPPALSGAVAKEIEAWRGRGGTKGLWAGDASLWTNRDEAKWLGWIPVVSQQIASLTAIRAIADDAKGFSHALLLGMGGSSLCPEVWTKTFAQVAGAPALHVLDSTDPAEIRAVEEAIDLRHTLFIVSSKSGSTLEPNIFKAYFFDRAKSVLGAEAAQHFVAITDPGSDLEKVARRDGFRHIYAGVPSIGGRYSALSNFGIVPAATMGLDVARLLAGADRMLHACAPDVAAGDNPGLVLGITLGVLAARGIDKLTLVASPGIRDLGAWLEQLIAESTGKLGKGIIPVDREALAAPDRYGDDRVFVYLRLADAPDAAQDRGIETLERAGRPVVRIDVPTSYDLAQEFVRWEVATAIAGSVIGIDPFDQPDVEASKVATRTLTSAYETTGSLPAESPFFTDEGVMLFADPKNTTALKQAVPSPSLAGYLGAHLARLGAGDYFALLGYIAMTEPHERALEAIRHRVRDGHRVATCLGFGPRFLHSTGQAYKGGPNTGVFLQVTCDDARDLGVPGQRYTFGIVKAAQARGDFQVLADRGRRALRVHLHDVEQGLGVIARILENAR